VKTLNNKHVLWSTIIVVLFSSLVSFTGCERVKDTYERIKETYGKKKTDGQSNDVREAPVYAVNTVAAVQGQIQDYIALSGDIVSGSSVDAYSDAAGKITQLFVSLGDRVNKGSAIAAVDPSRPGMTYNVSIASSPISGTVIALPAQVGMTVSQAVPLARISGSGALEIKLNVAERFISKMAMNLPCEITLDAWPGEVFQGRISEVSPTVDPASRTMEIKVNVNNTDFKLKAGMFAKVKIITEHKSNIVKVPASAVINRFGEQYVFIIDKTDPENPMVNKRLITTGIIIDSIAEVQKGLSANDEIVVRGQTLLNDGVRVNIIEQVAPLSAN
jgi:multidrug efflux pump subunit AcrA (membrane-fusion protein)